MFHWGSSEIITAIFEFSAISVFKFSFYRKWEVGFLSIILYFIYYPVVYLIHYKKLIFENRLKNAKIYDRDIFKYFFKKVMSVHVFSEVL